MQTDRAGPRIPDRDFPVRRTAAGPHIGEPGRAGLLLTMFHSTMDAAAVDLHSAVSDTAMSWRAAELAMLLADLLLGVERVADPVRATRRARRIREEAIGAAAERIGRPPMQDVSWRPSMRC